VVPDRQQQPTPARYATALPRRHRPATRFTAEAGRDPESVALTYRVKRYGEAVPGKASDGERRLFSGSTADLIADLRALCALGVSAFDIDFECPDPEASIAAMRRFKEEVVSRF